PPSSRDRGGGAANGGFGLGDEAADDLGGGQDFVDQAGVLADEEGSPVGVAGLERAAHARTDLRAAGAQLRLASGPGLDQLGAPDPRERAGPDPSARDVRNLGQERVVAVAREDGLLERVRDRRLRAREEARAHEDAVGPERERGGQALARRDAAGREDRQRL